MSLTYELDDDEEPSDGVYAAVAEASERSPMDLPPLARTVDPDALDALLTDRPGASEVTLEYGGYQVTVTAAAVHLEPLDVG
jgi:hypothetical protein